MTDSFNPDYVLNNSYAKTTRGAVDALEKAKQATDEFRHAVAEAEQAIEEAKRTGTEEALKKADAALSESDSKEQAAFEAQAKFEETAGQTAFEIYGPMAREKHVTFLGNFIPGFAPFSCDTDVYLGLWDKTVRQGMYLLKNGEDALSARIYRLILDPDELEQVAEQAKDYDEYTDEDGVRVKAIRDAVTLNNLTVQPIELEPGRYLTFLEYVAWLAIDTAESDEQREAIFSSAYKVEVKDAEAEHPDIEEVTLAQFDLEESFVNHSLAAKTLEGMVSIAYGQESYTLTPKRGKSNESYTLTGSTENLSRFFAEDAGNEQIMARILETVHMLMNDKRAEGFTHKGRVWFTTAKILEETLRTESGTLRGRNYAKSMKLVDDALWAASGLQISGTNPAGKPLNVEYFINAVRRDKVTHRGNVYRDVWGFAVEGWTVNDYAAELEHAYRYPLLMLEKPLTVDQAAIERYLKDKMHQARGMLYTKDGRKQRRKTWVQTLSWETIFTELQPLRKPDGRQKKKIVSDFQTVLTALAGMDARDKLHPGRPLYIKAHSERDGSKGRGAGAWRNLVIEYSSNFHTPKIDLI